MGVHDQDPEGSPLAGRIAPQRAVLEEALREAQTPFVFVIGEAIEACFPGTGINAKSIQRELDTTRRAHFPEMKRRYWRTRYGYTAEECVEVMEKWLSIRTRSKYNKKADLAGGYAKMKRAEEALKDSLTYNEAMKVLGFPKAEWKGGRIFYPRFIRGKQGVQLKHNPVQAAYPFLKRSKFVSADEVRRVYDELEGVSSEDDEGDRE